MSSSCIECVISLHDAEILQEGWCSFRSTRSRTCDRQHQVDRLNVASNRQLATFNVIELREGPDPRAEDGLVCGWLVADPWPLNTGTEGATILGRS